MFNPSRDEVRTFFRVAWEKRRAGAILEPLETLAAEWIAEHPEYHPDLEAPQAFDTPAQDYRPESGRSNPFLHLAMHLSISEQVSIDQPPGIRRALEKLSDRLGSLHDAQHEAMECLGEMLWKSQRDGAPPDGAAYLDCIERRAGRLPT